MPETTLPNDVTWELEQKNIVVGAHGISRSDFDKLSPLSSAAVVKAGVVVYDSMQQRHFDKLTSMDRAEFLKLGGRVTPDRW